MNSLPNLALMSVSEYVDFLESTSLYTGVDAFELNMEYHIEMGAISMERYERAKSELLERSLSPIWNETEYWRNENIVV
jgi:hypothetical protein